MRKSVKPYKCNYCGTHITRENSLCYGCREKLKRIRIIRAMLQNYKDTVENEKAHEKMRIEYAFKRHREEEAK